MITIPPDKLARYSALLSNNKIPAQFHGYYKKMAAVLSGFLP
jgi:hypothetical protein